MDLSHKWLVHHQLILGHNSLVEHLVFPEAGTGPRVVGNTGHGKEFIKELLDRHWANYGTRELHPNGHQNGVTKAGVCRVKPLGVAFWPNRSTLPRREARSRCSLGGMIIYYLVSMSLMVHCSDR